MVRLKDINVIDIYNDLNKFQFLMVRLKDIYKKSGNEKVILFQFLMVRLKEIKEHFLLTYQ